jgi:hypothetical protein
MPVKDLECKYNIREEIPLTSDQINIYIDSEQTMNIRLKLIQNLNLNIPVEIPEE